MCVHVRECMCACVYLCVCDCAYMHACVHAHMCACVLWPCPSTGFNFKSGNINMPKIEVVELLSRNNLTAA